MGRLLDKYNQKYGLAEKVQERKDIDSWQELEEENTSYANKLTWFDNRISAGEYISPEELKVYGDTVTAYIDTSNRLRNVFKYQGYQFTDADEADWATQVAGLNERYDKVYGVYSPHTSEDSWKAYLAEIEQHKADLEFDTEAGRVELAEIHKQIDAAKKDIPGTDYYANILPRKYGLVRPSDAKLKVQDLEAQAKELEDRIVRAEGLQAVAELESYSDPTSQNYDPDFEEKSVYDPTKRSPKKAGGILGLTSTYDSDPYLLYAAINGDKDAIAQLQANAGSSGASSPEGNNALGGLYFSMTEGKHELVNMDEEEKKTYNYLEHEYGIAKANEYYTLIRSDLFARERYADLLEMQAYTKEHTFAASVSTWLMAPLKGLSYMGQAIDYIDDGRIDENAPYNKFTYTSSDIRSTRAGMIEEFWDNALGEGWGKVGSWGYQLGMSMGDFVMATAVSGGNQFMSLAIMGTGAAADMTIAAKQRGLSDDQAFALGTIAGAAEVITEKIGLDALFDVALKGKGALVYTLKNAFSEGLEEPTSSVINTLADLIISGDKAELVMKVQEYIDAGVSEGAAVGKVLGEYGLSLLGDAAGGMLSGGFMAIPGSISMSTQYRDVGAKIIKKGTASELKAAADALGVGTNKFNLSKPGQVGQLYYTVAEKISESGKEALTGEMVKNGVSQKAATKLSGVIIDAWMGVEVDESGMDLIAAALKDDNVTGAMEVVLNGEDSPVRIAKAQLAGVMEGTEVETVAEDTAEKTPEPATEIAPETFEDVKVEDGALEAVEQEMAPEEVQGETAAENHSAVDSAIQGYISSGSVTNRTAESILADPQALDYLQKETGVLITGSAAQKRAAVKAAVTQLAKQTKKGKRTIAPKESEQKAEPKKSEQTTEKKVDMEGKTFLESSGEEVKSISVKRIGKGGAVVTVNGGTEAKLSDVSFGDERMHLAYSRVTSVEGMTAEAANKILSNPKADRFDFINEAIRAFQGGLRNESVAEKLNYDIISADEARALFEEGRKAVAAQAQAAQDLLDEIYQKAKAEVEKTGKKVNAELRYADDLDIDELLEDERGDCARLAARMVPALQGDIVLYDGPQDGKMGYYKYGEDAIYLNVNAKFDEKSMMAFVLAHEMVHRGRKGSALKYQAFADLLIEEFTKKGVSLDVLIQEQLDAAKAAKVKMTEPQAFEEVICDACQRMLVDTNAGRILAEWGERSNQNRDFLTKLKDFLTELFDRLRKVFAGERSENRAVAAFRALDKSVQNMLAEMYVDMTKDAAEKLSVIKAADLDITREFLASKDISYNLAAAESHKAQLSEEYSENATVPLDTLMQRYDKILRIWKAVGIKLDSKFLNEWNSKVGTDQAFSVFKAQSGYKYNIELSTMCKKGVALFEAIDTIVRNEIMKEIGTKVLGKAEKEILYDILKSKGFEIPCAICYVEQARQREGVIIDAFLNGNNSGKLGWNSVLDSIEAEMAALGMDFAFPQVSREIATEKYTPANLDMDQTTQDVFFGALMTVANKEIERYNKESKKNRPLIKAATRAGIQAALKGNVPANLKIFKVLAEYPSARFRIEGDLLYSSMTTRNLAGAHQQLYSLFNAQGGVSGYKTKQTPVVYWGDLLGKKWRPSDLRKGGGIRNQSNSDHQMYTLLDQVQMYIDLTAKGYYLQAYTKVVSELKLLGLSRAKMNASLIPKVVVYYNNDGTVDVAQTKENAGLDENGNPIFDDFEGINSAEAFMLIADPEYSKSIGGVCIGYSDKHIWKLLDDSRVQLIIGFHDKTNDPNKRYRGARYAKNYNGLNEAKKLKADGKYETVHVGFNRFVQQAEKMFRFDSETETYSGTVTRNGKTYTADDIPRLAADLYLEKYDTRDASGVRTSIPAYDDFKEHPNYYKLLADFSLYDSQGHYAPHRKVAYNMPATVPYLDANGNKQTMPTADYIQAELEKEMATRDELALQLADESDQGIIPQFRRALKDIAVPTKVTEPEVAVSNKLPVGTSSRVALADAEVLTDSDGRQLSEGQRVYFAESVVRDENGNLLVMYHGTSRGGFTIFDVYGGNYGLFGGGSYFTSSRSVAQNYTKKGKGDNPQVYAVYLNIKNPLDMDAQADPAEWAKAFPDATFPESGTNEQFFRAAEEFFMDEGYRTWEAQRSIAESIQDSMGYDGITHIGGGRVDSDGERHRVYIAFEQNQIKRTDNLNPTENEDIDRKLPVGEASRMALVDALEPLAKDDKERKALTSYRARIEAIAADEKRLAKTRAEISRLWKSGDRKSDRLTNLREAEETIRNRLVRADSALLDMEGTGVLKELMERKVESRLLSQRKKLSAEYRESRERASERRKASDVRGKIKRLKAKMQSTLLNPSEKNFVPVSLFEAIVSVLELVDDNTELYKPDGTINQAQAARDATYRRLNKLKDLYSKLDKTNGGQYKGEFDEYVAAYLDELFEKYEGRSLAEMGLEELGEMYEILKSIQDVIMDARKLIGMNELHDVYEATDAIAAEQQAITDGRKNGKRNFVGIANDTMNNHALSPMRNIERMAGYDEDSMLVKLFRDIEKGVRKGNLFMMRAYKMFEKLTASPKYDDALYKEVTVDGKPVVYTDYKGRKFGLSKMQMMQAILSYEREQAMNNLNHIATGGFTFADLRMLRKGKLREAISEENSHRVPAATEMVLEFIEILKDDKWCQDYMAVAREFFNHMAKDAINEASIATKHRAVATGEAYVPFETDQNFVVKEISAANDVQQTINSYGMLKDTQNNAPQPLIVTGLNNLIERHISQVGTVYGLAVPIRNFNKVWTTKTQPGVDGAPTVRGLIEGNWGTKGAAHIEQAVQDVQGPRKRDQGVFADLYRKLKSNYIGATFLFNLSVVMKQLGSLFTATSMIQWRNPVSMMANLIYTATHFQEIAAEVDQYTASVWMRRQGLSDAELSTLMTEGQKTWLGKLAKKGPAWANPTKWITGMDSAVALSLWRYCKEDVAARTGLEGEALLEATAEFFDDVVENTQSMTDVLHRPEIQKNTSIFSEPFAMFKTDVYQMAGQLNVAAGRAFANPTKENKRALGKTVYSIAMSAVWGQLMTAAFAALRYKMDRYKDDEDELTWKSFLKRSLFSLGGDLAGYVFPIFGSEIVGIGEALAYGETDDFLDNMTMSNVNELYSMIIGISNAMVRGKEVSPQKWNKLIAKALQLFGVPTNNIIRLWEAIRKHAADIAEGEFFAFNEE